MAETEPTHLARNQYQEEYQAVDKQQNAHKKQNKKKQQNPKGGPPKSVNEQHEKRLEKLAELREMGIQPYQDRFPRTHSLKEAAALPEDATDLVLTGRLMLKRSFGKLSFAHIQDATGRLQIALERDKIETANLTGRDANKIFKKYIDIGDFLGVEGDLMRTRTGELTLSVKRFTLLSKALRPLPEKFHGLKDLEACYRKRYLDLIMNEDTRERFALRRRVIRTMRDILDREGFVEVETPIMVPTASGALATPFVTHHNALDIPAFLRIAPETYLKRLLVGGLERVYEFASSFRNEGMDPSHLQEFNLLEYYCAYWNYEDNMNFTEKLISEVIQESTGGLTITYQGNTIDFTPPWPRKTFREVLAEFGDLNLDDFQDAAALREEIKRRKLEVDGVDKMGYGNLVDQLYKKCCRPSLIQPLFLTGHPIELSPLARKNDADPSLTDRFQLVVAGWEIVNAYSELIDPVDQRQRFEEQARLRQGGDTEAMATEEDYLLAMEYGMPPVSGWGMGMERFISLLCDRENLRDVVFFPFMRKQDLAVVEELDEADEKKPKQKNEGDHK